MDRERAETFLRLLAEAELRRVTASPRQSAPPPPDVQVTELFSRHYQALVRLAALLVGDVPTAEDVVRDAFVALHDVWERLNAAENALAYLRQAVVNRSRSVLRHRTVADKNMQKPPPEIPGAGHGVLVSLERSAVVAALGRLPDRQREAIELRSYGDLSEGEIAALMGISRGAVKSHTARGMASLRAALEAGDLPEAEITALMHVSRGAVTSYAVRGMASLRAAPEAGTARLSRVARVLTAVGALDEQAADQILDHFTLALDARGAGSGGQRMARPAGAPAARRRLPGAVAGQAHPPGSAGPQAAPGRVVPLGQVIAFRGADVTGELYLLSYARMAPGPQLSAFARTRGKSELWQPARPRLFVPFTVTDDRGTTYQAGIRDISSGPLGWTLELRPDPPHDPRWLDLHTIPGDPAARIDLDHPACGTRPTGAADVTVRKAALSPGEYLLHTIAARMLAAAWPAAPDTSPLTAQTPWAIARLAGGLEDIIAALQASGALSPLSAVPGQLTALCAGLDVRSHGITAPPARDLPEPPLSVLAWYRRRRTVTERDGCAAAAAVLPGLDGIRLMILGLHNHRDSTVLHMHASGPRSDATYGPDDWAIMWVRDSGGRWHATRTLGRSGMNGEVALRIEVVPPLSRATTWIELLAAGQSAEIRATVPLAWE